MNHLSYIEPTPARGVTILSGLARAIRVIRGPLPCDRIIAMDEAGEVVPRRS